MDSNENDDSGETLKPSTPTQSASGVMTLEKAIELGEYEPDYLATFPEWHTLTKHVQWEYVNRALKNREGQVMQQYAAVNNILDFSRKPEAHAALKNVEKQMKIVRDDRERLLIKFAELE